jgi:hypothetical protein
VDSEHGMTLRLLITKMIQDLNAVLDARCRRP